MTSRRRLDVEHDDERRATHEAGHVAVALAVGWPFMYVTIDPDPRFPGLLGHVQYIHPVRRYAELRAWGATFLGGREAERQLLGGYGIGSLEDERLVAEVIAGSFSSDAARAAAERDAILALATRIVASRTRDIEAIRDALLEHRRLTAADIRAMPAVIEQQRRRGNRPPPDTGTSSDPPPE